MQLSSDDRARLEGACWLVKDECPNIGPDAGDRV